MSLALALALTAQALGSGITNSGDDLRTGWYPNQPSLTPQLVSGGTFGQLWSANVEGQVYAQPLLSNGTLLIATETNKLYGLNPTTGAQQWTRSLGTPWNPADLSCGDLTPSIGVTSTPVIDTTTNTAYLTHKTYVSGTSGAARWYVDAIDVATGVEKSGFPVELSGTAQNAPGRTFNPTNELQRPGLLLMEGAVYAAFGSHCDFSPWQGWVFGVSTAGQVKARWVANATETGAGIWQSGAGLTSDGAGTLLLSTGNGGAPTGPIPGNTPPANLGESVVRLRVQADGTLKATDFFAPFDAPNLDTWDADFASGGVTGLPNEYFGTAALPHLAVAVGKQGYVYLLNRDNLGGIGEGSAGADNVVQRIGPYGGVWSRPGVWPGDGGWVYIPTASGGNSAGGSAGNLRVYSYGLSGTSAPTLSLQATSPDAFGFGTSAPVITSDGTTSGSALVWTVWMPGGSGAGAQLRAYDPLPVSGQPVLRWSAPVGTAAKFATPGVGAGRIYVGTRDGHVLGFGSPVTPPLTGSTLAFGATILGHSTQKTLTLTATETLTLSTLASSSSQFALGTAAPALPATLSAGQTISVPVTFTPTQTGIVGATITATTSTGKTATFAVSGTGQAASAQLEVTPKLVSFGGTAVGGHLSSTATFRNVGGAPLTINKVNLPAAPFSASGAPTAGATIAAGASLTVTVSFDPTQLGTFNDSIGLETTGGNGVIGLSGTAGAAGVLKVAGETNEYGKLQVGATAVTKSFTITNTGGTNVTITKSKPPVGGAFTATTSLPEGTTIKPGEVLTESVAFTPTGPGYTSGVWQINGDDTSGLHQVQFSGTGTVPAPVAGAWTNNGTASISGATLTLTGTASNSAGTSFFNKPLDTHHLIVTFDSIIGGGSGADGQTLMLADPTKGATTTSLGLRGGGLGFSGIPGIAVALDTYKNAVNPSANFMGISDGPTAPGADTLHWLSTNTTVPALRATRHVKIEVLNGTLKVWIEGTQVLSGAVTVPAQALLGFSGGSGGLTDNHQVANVKIEGDAPPSTTPATLKLTNTVSAPTGSPQLSAQMTFGGSCPTSFTTAALANGASVTPSLPTAVAGSPCTVSETAPAPAGGTWTTTASVNGGPEVTLTATNGQLTVPAFALLGGANTVSFKNTWSGPSSTSTVPDPTAGGWQLNGSSTIAGSELVLTPATNNQVGSAFWPQQIDPRNATIEYDASITAGSGADGLALVLGDASKGATPTALGVGGGGLGFSSIPGLAVALDEYKNTVNPSNNFAGITDGPIATASNELHWLATANLASALQGATHHVKVTSTNGTTLTVAIDGTQVLAQATTLPASAFLGFSAGTGGLNNRHAISHLVVTSGTGTPTPATLKITNAVQAPSGSAQASTTFTYSGTCPSSFTTAAIANGGSATPTLTGAVEGASCTLSEPVPAAPTGAKWTVSAAVNGGAAQTLAIVSGKVTIPAFALKAGVNTIAFTNTYTPPASGPLLPDPSAGGWQLNGTATLVGSALQLTAATAHAAGSAFWPTAIDPRALRIEYEASIGGGSGADGLALVFGDPAKGATPTALGVEGGGLGFSGTPGLAVALDEYKNAVNPSNDFVGVSDGPTAEGADLLHWLGTANLLVPLQEATHHVTVTTTSTTITVAIDGTTVLTQAATLPASAYLGFSAGTGGLTNRHAVANVVVTSTA
ncbi:MAG TPA: choice-of-anchor D domain-containing protein [Solirubrobacteraceae bacterium]|nr:choice-of-anchor D domain-containing protein [Solirubrobacteraceae bacterium]